MPVTSTAAMHLYLHQPTVIFKARTNMPAAISYPLAALVYDTVTVGAFGDIVPDMTLLLGSAEGLDDLGRVRVQNVATATTIPIGRVSQGTEDGTLNVSDNMYITVLDDYRVWAKLPYISPTGIAYKDSDQAIFSFTTAIPPVANCGPGTAGTINSGTGLLTVQFPAGGATLSYAMADGATITTYLWNVEDGTITVGTSASAVITATFPAGFRWVGLTVTDSNGKVHTTRCPVLAVNPAIAFDVTIDNFQVESHRLTQNGQTLGFRILEDLPRTTYPDGGLVMYWWGEPASSTDRSHMKLIGWHQSDSASIRAQKTGLLRDTVLNCVDIAGRLDALPGFPQALERVDPATTWEHMPTLTMSKALHYLLYWHSTVLSLADFFLPATGASYPAMRLDSTGASLYDQVNGRAKSMVPDHILVCNTTGQLRVLPDWMLQNVADRPAVTATLTEDYWQELRFEYTRPPRVHVLRASAVVASTAWTVIDGEDTLPLAFSIAPGDAFSQGTSEATQGEQLAISQATLNAATGHRYARLNARYAPFSIVEPSGVIWAYEPALLARAALNVSAATAAQRGLDFTSANGQVKAIDLRYSHTKGGVSISPTITWEREVVGLPAQTVTPEIPQEPDYSTPPPGAWVPPLPGDSRYYTGNMKGFVLWDGAHVMRTWDIQAASPTWALVDTGITGTIYDGQYVHVNATTIGMWLMTSTGIWWCGDIMATTPSWTSKLAIATVIAADVAPATGTITFKAMANYASAPGYLIVSTGPDTTDTANETYLHAYFWHTHDYGANWTQVDMNAFTYTNLSTTRCYCYCGHFAMEIFRSAPGTIWCVRQTPRVGTDGRTAVFYSSDLGHTWSKGFEREQPSRDADSAGFLHPFPSATDPTYMTRGNTSAAGDIFLYMSTDGWVTGSFPAVPSGYDGWSGLWRPNKRTFDTEHLMAWMKKTSGSTYDLMESYDRGVTWALLNASGLSASPASVSRINTPNGWPPDVLQWVVVRSTGALGVTTVRMTLNNFSTLADKQGNLSSILPAGAWSDGHGNGFALPKVSPNV